MFRCFIFIIASFFLLSPPALTDERARNGKCYVAIGYANDRSQVSEMATNSFINSDYFELFERKDKKVYLTLGKIDEKLFKKLQAENKTYDFGCSQGKGYEKRFGLNADFQMVAGNKKFLDTEAQFLSVVASIEIEKQRIVDAEVERQVQARLEKLEKKRKEEETAEAERQRLAELEKQRKAKEAAEAESQRLAALEKQRKAEEAVEKEKQRLTELEKQRKAAEEAEREKQRLAKIAAEKEKAFSLGYNSVDDMNLAIAAGFEDASSFNSIANELNQAFEGSGFSKKEWLLALNSLGGKSLLNSYRSFQSKDEWSAWIESSYKVAANIPKLLLKCDAKGGYYLIAHTFAKKPSADFLYVKNGFNHARWEFYNRLATRLVINPNSYVYPDYTYNLTGTGLRYKGYKTDINRNNGSLRILHEYRSPFSSEWLKSSGIYNCSAFKNVKRYQNLKSDYIKFTKAEAVRKKEKAEAEAKAKLESRKF